MFGMDEQHTLANTIKISEPQKKEERPRHEEIMPMEKKKQKPKQIMLVEFDEETHEKKLTLIDKKRRHRVS